jgi:hypothetical protein
VAWIRIDDGFNDPPKFVRARRLGGSAAIDMWLSMMAWSSRHLTDGVIPLDMLDAIEGPRGRHRRRALDALIGASLCSLDGPDAALPASYSGPGSVLLTSYLDYQPSKAVVLENRARKAGLEKNRRLGTKRAEPLPSPWPASGEPVPRPVPSRPVHDLPERKIQDLRAGTRDERPGIARTYSMPSEQPPKDYLDQAVLEFTPVERAKATWKWYWGAGLPANGVERLYSWLLQQAREKAARDSKAPSSRGGPAANPQDDVRAYAAIQPQGDHIRFAEEHAIDLNAIVDRLRKDPKAQKLSTPQQWAAITKLLERAAKAKESAA